MDGHSAPKKRREEVALRQLARLTIERGQTLRYASAARGKRAAVFYAPNADPTLTSNYELLRCAIDEAGISAAYFDVSRLANVGRLKGELQTAEVLIVLDDPAFRDAPFAKENVIWACTQRPDLDWTVVRLGDPEQHEDLEFYLARGNAIDILDPAVWNLVALFLMQCVARALG